MYNMGEVRCGRGEPRGQLPVLLGAALGCGDLHLGPHGVARLRARYKIHVYI